MELVFGFDIGTTSIGWAAIEHGPPYVTGRILGLGVRIFPEARDRDGTPLNQNRRQKRMVRRQLRRRRTRRRALNELLTAAGLLPPFSSEAWAEAMKAEPAGLRKQGLTEQLEPYQFGRALYHLAQRRHFKGRDLEEKPDAAEAADEKEAQTSRQSTLAILRSNGWTLGEYLASKGPHERQRRTHADRDSVVQEFDRLWTAQARFHPMLRDGTLRARIEDLIFAQRPVFWRLNTLGRCRFMPGEALCPKGSWLSQQRRMLEKLNNLAIVAGNIRPLTDQEWQEARQAILDRLQCQASMTWPAVRTALKPLLKRRGEAGQEKTLRFNLEEGGDDKLLGNATEARLAHIFGPGWATHPHRQAIRDAVQHRLWNADYGQIGDQRVVIRPKQERQQRRSEAAQSFITDFGVSAEQASALKELKLPTGWEPFSTAALMRFMPHLEAGVRFGTLLNGSDDWAAWRASTFPNQDQPTGEVLDRLPSPVQREERERLAGLRNPTVIRVQNELRKVVNNLISVHGKPDRIRVELAREVGKSKREREEMQDAMRRQEKRRKEAAADLRSKGSEPSRSGREIEKWLLWKECQGFCPYTGDPISFDALFAAGEFEVEHIWPRSRSFDDSIGNKTLCRRDVNLAKGSRTPYEAFEHRPDEWAAIRNRLQGMKASKGGYGMSLGKVKRFLAESIPDNFAARQLNDTGFAARQAVLFLKRLWPDVGVDAPVHVQVVFCLDTT
ncbi:MAG: type II CRISPR RNA-guided endonuclease Cas9, partial [Rhodopila sp.]